MIKQEGIQGEILRLQDLETGKTLELRGPEILAGRSHECTLLVPYKLASRRHALLKQDSDGWSIVDLNSTNGTHINKVLLPAGRSRLLQEGDVIAFAGKEWFRVLPPEKVRAPFAPSEMEKTINDMYPGLAMFVRDVNLPEGFAEHYVKGNIIREKAFTDASCRIGGLVTSHRYIILSNHMRYYSEFEHGTHWGLFVAQKDSHFKVFGVYKHEDKTAIVLLHLPDDERWKLLQNTDVDIDEMLMEKACARFVTACAQAPIPELANERWLDRCCFPLGMSDAGELWPLE